MPVSLSWQTKTRSWNLLGKFVAAEERDVLLVKDRLRLFLWSASLKDFEESEEAALLVTVVLGVPALRLAVLPLEDLL